MSKKFFDKEDKYKYEDDLRISGFMEERGINLGWKYDKTVNNLIWERNRQLIARDYVRQGIQGCSELCQKLYANGYWKEEGESIKV
ncbi:hypothetical protein Scep_004203 [Stephania cephalantha]|uniref:Uncharacterized protein n=1 Tax=Stephania cephalantha TaxID=152367 RepID=A0AAP0PX29_9MAGN